MYIYIYIFYTCIYPRSSSRHTTASLWPAAASADETVPAPVYMCIYAYIYIYVYVYVYIYI